MNSNNTLPQLCSSYCYSGEEECQPERSPYYTVYMYMYVKQVKTFTCTLKLQPPSFLSGQVISNSVHSSSQCFVSCRVNAKRNIVILYIIPHGDNFFFNSMSPAFKRSSVLQCFNSDKHAMELCLPGTATKRQISLESLTSLFNEA